MQKQVEVRLSDFTIWNPIHRSQLPKPEPNRCVWSPQIRITLNRNFVFDILFARSHCFDVMPANLCLDNTCTRVVAPTSLSVRGATRSQIKPSSVRLVAVMRIHVQLLQQTRSSLKFVPPSRHVTGRDVSQLQDFLAGGGRLLVITGAGLSTESGIPDYRSDGVGLYARSTRSN